jgi:hypothetical protein
MFRKSEKGNKNVKQKQEIVLWAFKDYLLISMAWFLKNFMARDLLCLDPKDEGRQADRVFWFNRFS